MKGPVVILDATGGIGRAVVQAAVNAGRPVIAVSPDGPALAALRAGHRNAELIPVIGSIVDEASGAALAAALRELRRPLAGIIVASCREPARGRVLEQSNDKLQRILNEELLPHLTAARELVPLLAQAGRNGSYIVIGGPGSDQPWAGYGHRSIAAAATRMLLRVLHDEARTLAVRVQLLAVEMPARTDDNGERACAQWPSAVAIGERALALIDQTDSREPAEAVVRYAWHAAPPLSERRAIDARKSPRPAPIAKQSFAQPIFDPTDDPSPLRTLDDTWALLKPLLTATTKKASTP
jgi:NAD(P)-dependent dehydrogenase (short-subunit alcohol dehydrogenase family)